MLEQLCVNFVEKITDYRIDEISPIDTAHICRWLDQFDEPKRIPILTEMSHLIDKIYFSEKRVRNFLEKNVNNPALIGTDAISYWNNVNVLNIQQGGTSQNSMKALLSSILLSKYEIMLQNSDANSGIYIYLDDACYSGNRIIQDIISWLDQAENLAINKLIIITIASYSYGKYYAEREIKKKQNELGKCFPIEWYVGCQLENSVKKNNGKLKYTNDPDLFVPRSLPNDDPCVQQYVEYLTENGFPPTLREVLPNQKPKIFSSEENRNFIEQEFLKKGCYIKQHICIDLPESIRPLGFSGMMTLGFGSPIITYKNCPNTAPLALWAGEPWYPLFPRRVN
jgi:hypothetical protein